LKELVFKELTPSLRDDFLHFFDNVAFADILNGVTVTVGGPFISQTTREKLRVRREASNQIEEDRMHGFLAYDSGKPVGWVNAAPRGSYPGVHWLMSPGPIRESGSVQSSAS